MQNINDIFKYKIVLILTNNSKLDRESSHKWIKQQVVNMLEPSISYYAPLMFYWAQEATKSDLVKTYF